MKLLINEVGRGPKRPLKFVITKDGEKTINQQDQIEQAIIDHNIAHHKAVFKTKVYQDKIYYKLSSNKIRDKILNRKLEEEDCSNKEVFKFLSLLQRNNRI